LGNYATLHSVESNVHWPYYFGAQPMRTQVSLTPSFPYSKPLLMTRCYVLLALALTIPQAVLFAQDDCEKRTFITTTSLDQSGFTVQTYPDELLDSLFWDFGDGSTQWQTENVGSGSTVHTYATPGAYTVTLERWGTRGVFGQEIPFYCLNAVTNVVYDQPTDSLCGGDFLRFQEGNMVTFSNRSVIHAPAFNSHSTQPLWDFGNGQTGDFINRIYEVDYEPGTWTACLYYGGFSFNDGGYFYDCSTCSTFTIGTQSIADLAEDRFSLYPNPAGAWLELASTLPITATDVRLFDHVGRVHPAAVSVLSASQLRMEVGGLAAGTYYLRMQEADGVRMLPFVKL
jgi:hypothetical protein